MGPSGAGLWLSGYRTARNRRPAACGFQAPDYGFQNSARGLQNIQLEINAQGEVCHSNVFFLSNTIAIFAHHSTFQLRTLVHVQGKWGSNSLVNCSSCLSLIMKLNSAETLTYAYDTHNAILAKLRQCLLVPNGYVWALFSFW